jgi:hypothetical protein
MNGQIDIPGAQRGVDLGGEEFLALDLRERRLAEPIAARVDPDEFDLEAGVELLQAAHDGTALRPRQQRTTSA